MVKPLSYWGLLAALLVALQLSGHIAWSWWVVLAPLFWPAYLFIFLVVAFMTMICLIVLVCVALVILER